MAKRIIDTGKTARRIEVSDRPARRIEPEAFAEAIGAEAVGEAHAPNLDPLALGALGSALIKRLRSSGGRPALADATEICRVPLSPDDVKGLEKITEQIEQTTGAKPSPGQVASVIVHNYLSATADPKVNPAVAASPANAPTNEDYSPHVSLSAVKELIDREFKLVQVELDRLAK